MTCEQENEYLKKWEDKALNGEILSIKIIQDDLANYLGIKVDQNSMYRILTRNGWRKIKFDITYPKNRKKTQENCKKNTYNCWLPPAHKEASFDRLVPPRLIRLVRTAKEKEERGLKS
jgi:hypothetical protein